jgi:hypothetical protein
MRRNIDSGKGPSREGRRGVPDRESNRFQGELAMTSSILRSVLCLTLLACTDTVTAPDPEARPQEEVSTMEQEIYGDDLYWYCENAGPELCVVLPGWLPRSECVAACQSVGVATPRCVLRWDPACAF